MFWYQISTPSSHVMHFALKILVPKIKHVAHSFRTVQDGLPTLRLCCTPVHITEHQCFRLYLPE